jgi:hypothetical protein
MRLQLHPLYDTVCAHLAAARAGKWPRTAAIDHFRLLRVCA